MNSFAQALVVATDLGNIWLTPHQRNIDLQVLALLDHPKVVAKRTEVLERFKTCPEFSVADAPATMNAAVDGLLFSCLQLALNRDPSRPGIVWIVRQSYRIGDRIIPATGQGGDNPDRAYRLAGVSPDFNYEIRGRRHPTHPSAGDLYFEALRFPGLYGQPLIGLQADNIDVAEDGSFSITADNTPANGRRNHLYLPPETTQIVIRDTLFEWAGEIPNEIGIFMTRGQPQPERSRDELAEESATLFEACAAVQLGFMQACLREQPANQLLAFERPVKWGMGGGLFAINRFELADDEALVITLNQCGAQSFNISVDNPWTVAVDYSRYISSLNHIQAQPNTDGSYTFVISSRDPGVYNWLDTGGLHTGAVNARWDPKSGTQMSNIGTDPNYGNSRPFAPERLVSGAVLECRVVKLHKVESVIPAGQSRVSPEERDEMRARRFAEHGVRMTGRVLSEAWGPSDNEEHSHDAAR